MRACLIEQKAKRLTYVEFCKAKFELDDLIFNAASILCQHGLAGMGQLF